MLDGSGAVSSVYVVVLGVDSSSHPSRQDVCAVSATLAPAVGTCTIRAKVFVEPGVTRPSVKVQLTAAVVAAVHPAGSFDATNTALWPATTAPVESSTAMVALKYTGSNAEPSRPCVSVTW